MTVKDFKANFASYLEVMEKGVKAITIPRRGRPAEFELLPMKFEIALDAGYPRILRDPMDRAIAATARIHSLTLVTSDQRICDCAPVPVLS